MQIQTEAPISTPMLAFHGSEETKRKYLDRIADHRRMDNLVRGATGANGKGCAVWCTLNKYEHAAYETELGIPRSIARLEDGLFESLPIALAMEWPQRFLSAIRPGADLSLVMAKFFVWMLIDPIDGVIRFAKKDKTRKVIQTVGDLYQRKASGEDVQQAEWRAAYAAAAAASAAAAAAADAAADASDAAADAAYAAAAYASDASDAAADAAYAAYAAAAYAAYAAAAYASDASDASDAAYAAAYAAYARSKTHMRQADKLIELLEAA